MIRILIGHEQIYTYSELYEFGMTDNHSSERFCNQVNGPWS